MFICRLKLHFFSLFMFVALFIQTPCHAVIITNSSKDFKKLFTSEWDKLSESQKNKRMDEFEVPYSLIYDNIIYQKQIPGWQEKQANLRSNFFQKLTSLKSGMQDIFSRAFDIASDQEESFKSYFPDAPKDLQVYFIPSLFQFAAVVRPLPDHAVNLIIGVDAVAGSNESLNVLFAHEFFHAYVQTVHVQNTLDSTMASPLWQEGMATFISGFINPDATEEQILGSASLAKFCQSPSSVKELAQSYLPLLTSESDTYSYDWFSSKSSSEPTRKGYCLGWQVIRSLIKKSYTITEMVKWSPQTYQSKLTEELTALANAESK